MTCGACDGDTGDGQYLCARCTELLEKDLSELTELWEDLQVTVAKLDKGADSVGTSGGHAGSSEPVNLTASDKARTLTEILVGWAFALGHPTRTALQASDVLFSQIREVRRQDWAPVLKDELNTAMRHCRAATDRAAELLVIGRCQTVIEGLRCPDQVKAIQGQPTGRCRTCGETVDVQEHQLWMIASAWHIREPLPHVLRALKHSGHLNVPIKRVEHWVERGNLRPAARTKRGNLYTPAAVVGAYMRTPSGKRDTKMISLQIPDIP